jgi:hypothetical protein
VKGDEAQFNSLLNLPPDWRDRLSDLLEDESGLDPADWLHVRELVTRQLISWGAPDGFR